MANALVNVAASSTDSVVVAAQAGRRIRVYQIASVGGATATNVTFNTKGAGAGTALSPIFAFGVNGGAVLPYSPRGWFDTNRGEGLSVTTGTGSTQGIIVGYDVVGTANG
jgi:hypothetical protein